ncbi:cytochrome P450 2K1-like [Gastrophryne carolinensis]
MVAVTAGFRRGTRQFSCQMPVTDGQRRRKLYNLYPRIGNLFGVHKEIMQNMDELNEFILKHINHHKQEYDANNLSGYIDAYLMKQEQESSKTETYFDDDNLVYTVLDLFAAGTETTSTTLCWAIFLMMKYPDIQKKVQEEIREHIKPGQMPSMDARRNMPYTDAVVHEIQRFANIIPLNVSHTTPKDVYFQGYCIPKGTEVVPLLTSVLYDKTQWKSPDEFNPNNFLDDAGKFVKNDAFMPFSAGRRACVGESLVKMELFLFFTGLLQSFTFYPAPGVSREDLSLKAEGFLLFPLPHLVCAKLNL